MTNQWVSGYLSLIPKIRRSMYNVDQTGDLLVVSSKRFAMYRNLHMSFSVGDTVPATTQIFCEQVDLKHKQ